MFINPGRVLCANGCPLLLPGPSAEERGVRSCLRGECHPQEERGAELAPHVFPGGCGGLQGADSSDDEGGKSLCVGVGLRDPPVPCRQRTLALPPSLPRTTSGLPVPGKDPAALSWVAQTPSLCCSLCRACLGWPRSRATSSAALIKSSPRGCAEGEAWSRSPHGVRQGGGLGPVLPGALPEVVGGWRNPQPG